MSNNILTVAFSKEIQAEYNATKKCLERIPESLHEYKPHPKSMTLGYLSLLVAEIPLWISAGIEKGEINFQTFQHQQPSTNQELLEYFENNFESAITALHQITDDSLNNSFVLKNGEQELMRQTKYDMTSSTINHWVHHRVQLTVYMRLNDILVPSIYGPSADDRSF